MNTRTARCRATNTYAGTRIAPCRFKATGEDGYCTRHRKVFAPRPPYTCLACGTKGLIHGESPELCADHKQSVDA